MTNTTEYIKNRVHELYWQENRNCARTTIVCLSELFRISIEKQVMDSAIGMHGAGGYRAQCGLAEGGLMFIGIYGETMGMPEQEIVKACYTYGKEFETKFGSLRCMELRPSGFHETDPPHMCEGLTCVAIAFTYQFIKELKTSEAAENDSSKINRLFSEGERLVEDAKSKLRDRSYRFDLTSKMEVKSEYRALEKHINILYNSDKIRDKDVEQLEVLILRLRTTMDGLVNYYSR